MQQQEIDGAMAIAILEGFARENFGVTEALRIVKEERSQMLAQRELQRKGYLNTVTWLKERLEEVREQNDWAAKELLKQRGDTEQAIGLAQRFEHLLREAQDHIKAAEPYCLTWSVIIPSLKGPYTQGWQVHDNCPPWRHCLILRQTLEEVSHE